MHCTIGPEGAIYIADFYDARITHVDPRDNWDRSNGRIYRLRATNARPSKPRNLGRLTNAELVKVLAEDNQWARRTARRLLAQRHVEDVLPALARNLQAGENNQLALESLWALHAVDAFPNYELTALRHPDASVRTWGVRLLADRRDPELEPDIRQGLIELAKTESNPEVVSQLTSTMQRLRPPDVAFLLRMLGPRGEFAEDPFIPQQYWWAIESLVSRSEQHARLVLNNDEFWTTPLFLRTVRDRIGRRFVAEQSDRSLALAGFFLGRVAGTEHMDAYIRGMEKALEGSVLDPVPKRSTRPSPTSGRTTASPTTSSAFPSA